LKPDNKSQFAPRSDEFVIRMLASNTKKTKFKCNIGIITFNELGQAGHFIHLESISSNDGIKCKKYEKIPEFQYLFNLDERKYYRVIQKPQKNEPEIKNEDKDNEFEESKDSFSSDHESKKEEASKVPKKSSKQILNEEDKDSGGSSEYEYEDEYEDEEYEEGESEEGEDEEEEEKEKKEKKSPTGTGVQIAFEGIIKDLDVSEINLEDNEKGKRTEQNT